MLIKDLESTVLLQHYQSISVGFLVCTVFCKVCVEVCIIICTYIKSGFIDT